jgi:hypothetical protein
MSIINTIDEIQSLLNEDSRYCIRLGLTGFSAAGRYPKIKVLVDNIELWAGDVKNTELVFDIVSTNDYLNVKILYFNKTDSDTIVQDDKIIENQYVRIDYLQCNSVHISGYDLSDSSLTNYNLTDSQKEAYTSNKFSWENIKTNCLYDNGVWEATLKKPILANLIKQKHKTQYIFDKEHDDILLKLQQYFEG